MANLFAGLTSGANALDYYQRGIETAGHNVANADVNGFSRQRVNAVAAPSLPIEGGQLGQGVLANSITRVRDQFLDTQFRAQLASLGYWEQKVSAMNTLETYVGERDIKAFQSTMNDFWANLETLHTKPEDLANRQTVVETTKTMFSTMLKLRGNYEEYRSMLNDQVRSLVSEANQLIDDIANLCKDIAIAQGKGQNPNDLLDRRDAMAERLCKITGATVGSSTIDEADSDYKIDLHGKLLVQGPSYRDCVSGITNVRHLVLVPMVGNNSYFDVQVEGNQYDHIDNLSVASVIIERGATSPQNCSRNGVHDLFVERLANGKTWSVGGGTGQLAGGDRLDQIRDKNAALGIDGSFGLQVGNAGVQAISKDFTNQAGVVLLPGSALPATEQAHQLRIAAGSFEAYVDVTWDNANTRWNITDSSGALLGTSTGAGGELMLEDMQQALNAYPQLTAAMYPGGRQMTLEGANTPEMRGHLLSITDIKGNLASQLDIANKNPAVQITVTPDDSLTTIANKINSAYMSELAKTDPPIYLTNPPQTPPMSPEQWLHANVVQEPNGTFYLALTSNVSGEANRINVLSGSVCGGNGDLSVARLLGFTEQTGNATSYMQLQSAGENITTIDKNAPWAQDAYFVFDNRHYLSESNSFVDARLFKTTNPTGGVMSWDNRAADVLTPFENGIRLNLHGENRYYDDSGMLSGNKPATITVRPHILTGEIYSLLESRDDMILGFYDQFDEIMYEMNTHVNAVHYSGHGIGDNAQTTGTAFFNQISGRYNASLHLRLNEALSKDLSLLGAASGDGKGYTKGAGDGTTAMRMAQEKKSKVLLSNSADFDQAYLNFIADMGMQGYRANYMLDAQENVVQQIEGQRQSVMGVNIDEEMIDIIRFQQGVGAISRYMTALDEMLERIINGMGA